jgi:integrase
MDFISSLNGGHNYKRWGFDVLRQFFDAIDEPWPFKRGEGPKLGKVSQPYLTQDQAETLLELTKANPMHHAMFRVACLTMARRAELALINIEDFNPPEIRIRTKKAGDERVVLLDATTIAAVVDYQDNVDFDTTTDGPLLSVTGRRLSPDQIGSIFRGYRRQMGLPEGLGLHAIRRGVATWLYKQGMRERELQEWGGWKTATMPHKYIQLVPGEVAKEALKIHPLAGG